MHSITVHSYTHIHTHVSVDVDFVAPTPSPLLPPPNTLLLPSPSPSLCQVRTLEGKVEHKTNELSTLAAASDSAKQASDQLQASLAAALLEIESKKAMVGPRHVVMRLHCSSGRGDFPGCQQLCVSAGCSY